MPEPKISRPPFHYAWVIAATGTLCIFACLGFGRFALGMLLPSMATTLKLSYSEIGFISTGNFLGYLAAVLFCGHIAKKVGSRRLIVIALVVISASMALISQSNSFFAILALYFITGMGSGAANVPVMGLITAWFDRTIRGRAAGFVVIGSGFAIIISGRLIPSVNRLVGPEGWHISWLILASVAAIAVAAMFSQEQTGGKRPEASRRRG
jgi:MFS family permease